VILKDTTYQDSDLADGEYYYEVTAVDTYGNESLPSDSESAKIYAPEIEQPYTPTGLGIIQINGGNAVADSTVEVFVETGSGPVSQGTVGSDAEGNFVSDVALTLGENRITARATDGNGNISRTPR